MSVGTSDSDKRDPAQDAWSPTTRDEVHDYLVTHRNWMRWGAEDELGALNLVTAEKRVEAAGLVRTGQAVSLSRDLPKVPGPANPEPAQHFMRTHFRSDHGIAADFYGILFHGFQTTHLDALCHIWDEDGLWGGRDPRDVLTSQGSTWAGVEHWRDGIVTRGILLDVPRFRGTPFVDIDEPVHGAELAEICRSLGLDVTPGDAVAVYCGRERFEAANPTWRPHVDPRPGLHASCLAFLREHDVAVLCWDQLDAIPDPYGMPWSVHAAIPAFGMAMVDNCRLEPLADACRAEGRYEFMLTVAPLPMSGGTGSPVNPLALL
jgi:hypothetical protein